MLSFFKFVNIYYNNLQISKYKINNLQISKYSVYESVSMPTKKWKSFEKWNLKWLCLLIIVGSPRKKGRKGEFVLYNYRFSYPNSLIFHASKIRSEKLITILWKLKFYMLLFSEKQLYFFSFLRPLYKLTKIHYSCTATEEQRSCSTKY